MLVQIRHDQDGDSRFHVVVPGVTAVFSRASLREMGRVFWRVGVSDWPVDAVEMEVAIDDLRVFSLPPRPSVSLSRQAACGNPLVWSLTSRFLFKTRLGDLFLWVVESLLGVGVVPLGDFDRFEYQVEP